MSALHISLFGRFQAQWQGKKLDGLGSGKVGELFCYLLLHRHRFHPREILAELFWPDYSNTLSRKYLRQALWQLQSTLNGSGVPGRSHMLAIEQSFIGVDMDSDFRLDIEDFEQAFALVRDIPGGELNSESASTLKDAVQLYHADLLDGWYQDWCLYERERLRTIYLIMLGKLMAYCEEYQEYESGLTYGHHILCCEPAHERTHRKMMRLYYLSGDRTAALRQYQRCVTTLRRELDVAPTHSTTKLYDQIKLDRLNTSVLDTIESDPDSTDTRTLPGFGGLSVH